MFLFPVSTKAQLIEQIDQLSSVKNELTEEVTKQCTCCCFTRFLLSTLDLIVICHNSIATVHDSSSTQVEKLYAQLEQEKSKNKSMKIEIAKMQVCVDMQIYMSQSGFTVIISPCRD